jgi:3-phenylpropionate/trans-cinnamate dioxygenase ferredoxin reductase subunit
MPERGAIVEPVVILGAGQAAAQTIVSLRQEGYEGRIVLIGDEPFLPYQRPPLSKAFLAGELARDRLLLRPPEFYARAGVELMLGTPAVQIDRESKQVVLADGRRIDYQTLVLATGGRPRHLDCPGAEHPSVHYLRSIADAEALRERLHAGARLAIIGGGYVGLEVAAVAVKKGLSVTLLEFAPRVLSRVACAEVAQFYEQVHSASGVCIVTGCGVAAIEPIEGGVRVRTSAGNAIDADLVLAGIGQLPNVELAQAAGIVCDNGIVVDDEGRTSAPDIYAAGDCTSHFSAVYGYHLRLESVHNAVEQARSVAAAICGKSRPYRQVPWFWSDQYDLKLQIAGVNRGYDQTVLRGDPQSRSFAVFYLQEGRLLAVDAINRTAEFIAAKPLIEAHARIAADLLRDPDVPLKGLMPPP